METIAGEPYNGRADLPALANAFQMEADELLPIGEALQLLGFAVFEEGDIGLTDNGRGFVEAETDERKELFAAAADDRIGTVETNGKRNSDDSHVELESSRQDGSNRPR